MNHAKLIEDVRTLLESADNTGCDGDVTVVNQSAVDLLRTYVDAFDDGCKTDDRGPFEDHRPEDATGGKMVVVRWSAHNETRIMVPADADEAFIRDQAGELHIIEGIHTYIPDTFEIEDINTEGEE